jgi:hypothetical protein
MKTGKTLTELAAEIERQNLTKDDYVTPSTAMSIVPGLNPETGTWGTTHLELKDTGRFGIKDIAHKQIAEHVKIPAPYYDRMRAEAPQLLADNVNHWFKSNPTKRMVRTLDGNARAVLSNSYRPLDNFDFANAILPVIAERKLEIVSCDITERRLYLKAIDKQEFQVPVGYKMGDGSHRIFDVCCPVFIASNSEVGFGRVVLETGVYTKACTNLAWFADGGFKRTHVGARHEVTDGVQNIDALLSERTKAKTDEALWMQLRDVLKSAFQGDRITKRIEMLTAAAENKIDGAVEKVVTTAADRFGLNEGERNSVLRHLIEGGSLTQYGLHAAFTRAAADVDDYDRATEMEYMGGKVVTLPRTEWQAIANAA